MTEIVNCPRCGSKVGCSASVGCPTSGYFCTVCDWREPQPPRGASLRETDLMAAAFLAGYCTDREGEATAETIDKVKAEFETWLGAVHPPQEGPGQ